MGIFHQHPDGAVIIRSDGRAYQATLADFILDSATAGRPFTDNGAAEHLYEQGVRHWETAGDVRMTLAMPWTVGDWYIAHITDLLAAQHTRTAPERAEAAQRAVRQARMNQLRDKRRTGTPLTAEERLEVLDLFLRV
jgi:hypothetical protein